MIAQSKDIKRPILHNACLIALGAGAVISACINSLFIFAGWFSVAPYGSDICLWFALFLVLPLVAALLAIPLALIFLVPRQTRKYALKRIMFALGYAVIAISCIRLGNCVRMQAFGKLADRSAPLIEAIKKFDAEQGCPPSGLKELVPEYLPSVPTTGMRAYPDYEYHVGEKAEKYEGNPWILIVHTPSGGINFDMFVYFPKGNYPKYAYGSKLERIKDWAYCHE